MFVQYYYYTRGAGKKKVENKIKQFTFAIFNINDSIINFFQSSTTQNTAYEVVKLENTVENIVLITFIYILNRYYQPIIKITIIYNSRLCKFRIRIIYYRIFFSIHKSLYQINDNQNDSFTKRVQKEQPGH